MKHLFKYGWAGIFLAIFGFQLIGTSLHFYDQPECKSSVAHHEESSFSSVSEHCKICDNLILLHAGFDIPRAWSLPKVFFSATEYTAKPASGYAQRIGQILPQRGPPVLS